jgi:hypothetical protein
MRRLAVESGSVERPVADISLGIRRDSMPYRLVNTIDNASLCPFMLTVLSLKCSTIPTRRCTGKFEDSNRATIEKHPEHPNTTQCHRRWLEAQSACRRQWLAPALHQPQDFPGKHMLGTARVLRLHLVLKGTFLRRRINKQASLDSFLAPLSSIDLTSTNILHPHPHSFDAAPPYLPVPYLHSIRCLKI